MIADNDFASKQWLHERTPCETIARIAAGVLLAVILWLVAGCSPSPSSGPWVYVSDGHTSAQLQLITLADGTRCAVLMGYKKAAMSCDWRDQK